MVIIQVRYQYTAGSDIVKMNLSLRNCIMMVIKLTKTIKVIRRWCCGSKTVMMIFLRNYIMMVIKLTKTKKVIHHWCSGYYIVQKKISLRNCVMTVIKLIEMMIIKHHWCFGSKTVMMISLRSYITMVAKHPKII